MERNAIDIARSAAESAAPYAELLANNFTGMAELLRNGEDSEALTALGKGAEDLEHFMTFLVMVGDMIEGSAPDTSANVETYRKRLLNVFGTLEPALNELDLVEVADTLEHDLANSLNQYKDLHPSVEVALKAA